MKKTTKELTSNLKKANHYADFYRSNRENFIDISLSEYLNELMIEKGLSVAQVVKTTGMGDYVYKLFNGKKEHPSRDILIRLAFGMGMTIEETDVMMRITHFHELDSKNKRDAAIMFSINKSFDLMRTNEMLFDLNLETLD